jgi:hypothetical protein
MSRQQKFRMVIDRQLKHSFHVAVSRSVVSRERISRTASSFPIHSGPRCSPLSDENSQEGSNRNQLFSAQDGKGVSHVDSHVPATRPGKESEPVVRPTELLRWSAYILGVLLFVGGITITLFGLPIAGATGPPANARVTTGLQLSVPLAIVKPTTPVFSPIAQSNVHTDNSQLIIDIIHHYTSDTRVI